MTRIPQLKQFLIFIHDKKRTLFYLFITYCISTVGCESATFDNYL